MTASSWIVIADDLTGAGDCAAAFAARGYSSFIWLHGRTPTVDCDVPVYETRSRHVDPREAYHRVRVLVERSRAHVFKKIDSTLKGNIVSELQAALDATGAPAMWVTPAHPAMGRTVRNGELLIHGEPSGQFVPRAAGMLVRDCTTVADLDAIVGEAAGRPGRVVLAGSGALCEALAASLPSRSAFSKPAPARRPLIVAGSTNPATLAQLKAVPDAEVLRVPRDERIPSTLAPFDALLIAGGDTARAVADHLGASGIRVLGEAARGVPYGTWIGGAAHGKLVATKAGGFGTPDTLANALDFLREE